MAIRHEHAPKVVAPELLARIGPVFVLHLAEGFGGAVKGFSSRDTSDDADRKRWKAKMAKLVEHSHFSIFLARLISLEVELVRLVVRLRDDLAEKEQAGVAA